MINLWKEYYKKKVKMSIPLVIMTKIILFFYIKLFDKVLFLDKINK